MNLTAGATLQNHKYVIQKRLRQSDLGVTYEAEHAYLAQPVALQTFNETVCQREDFAQLRQQFFSQVRSMVQQPQAHSIRILDCFEEAEMPFVVLEMIPGQPLPLLTDWLPVSISRLAASTPSTDETIDPTQLTASAAAPSQTQQFDPLLNHLREMKTHGSSAPLGTVAQDVEETRPPAPGYDSASSAGFETGHRSLTAQGQPARPTIPPTSMLIGTRMVQRPVSVRPPSKAWMPLSLIFLAMLGSILGAGYGLSLRLTPTTEANSAAEMPTLKPRLFSREQSFPSDEDWPISETPQIFPSDPTPIEEPVYRVSPPIESYTQPEFLPLPNETIYPDPYATPSPSPTLGTTTPTPLNDQPALPKALTEEPPAPIITTPPQISAPSVPLVPRTSTEPSLPAPEPIEPAPPALEPAPPAPPILPPTDPAVIKQ
jgi:hypothetical protein